MRIIIFTNNLADFVGCFSYLLKMLFDEHVCNLLLNLFQLRFCLDGTLNLGVAGFMLWRSALAWGEGVFTRPVLVDVGVNTDSVPVVAVVRPRGVGRGALLPRVPGLLPGEGRGAAVQRILASFAHEREFYRGRLGDWD